MKIFFLKRSLMGLLIVLFACRLYASDILLENIPLLSEIVIFESQWKQGDFFAIGKAFDLNKIYVLVMRNGTLTSPKLTSPVTSVFGKDPGFEIQFESGEKLYIPSADSSFHVPAAILDPIGPGLIHPLRGHEPLRKVNVDQKKIERLGLKKYLHPNAFKKIATVTTHDAKLSVNAPEEDVVLLAVPYEEKEKKQFQEHRNIFYDDMNRRLKDADFHRVICYQESKVDQPMWLYLWVFSSRVAEIEKKFKDWGKNPLIYHSMSEAKLSRATAPDHEGFSLLNQVDAAGTILYSLEAIDRDLPMLKVEQLETAVADVSSHLFYLRPIMDLVKAPRKSLKNWSNNSHAAEGLLENFIRPVQSIYLRAYNLLRRIGTPKANHTLLFDEDLDSAVRVSYLNYPINGKHTYFQTWLSGIGTEIARIQMASDEDIQTGHQSSESWSSPEFGFVRAHARDFGSYGSHILSHLQRPGRLAPLRIFGLVNLDAKKPRSDFIKFVLAADKVAEFQREKFKARDFSPISGSRALLNVISGLPDAVGDDLDMEGIAGFSRVRYYTQVMQILTELLNTSTVTIKNNATYLAILSAAVAVQKKVKKEYGTVPNQLSQSYELTDLTRELLLLHEAVQVRAFRGMLLNSKVLGTDCEAVMKPL